MTTPTPPPEVDGNGQPVLRGYATPQPDTPLPTAETYQRPQLPLPPMSTSEMAAQIPTGDKRP